MNADPPPLSRDELHQQLSALIVAPGITADRQRLKADMCTQFTDPREYLRELVTNAFDAGANKVEITVTEADGEFAVAVRDDGRGMNHQGVSDYLTLYRSRKAGDPERAIGRHGIGKLSIAAIPDQTRFALLTSTGREAWQFETESLLADTPITVHPVRPAPRRGSRFTVRYQAKNPLVQEVEHYRTLLERYLHHLPIRITLRWETEQSPRRWVMPYRSWTLPDTPLGRVVRLTVAGRPYEAVLDLGPARHALYQNRVFVTDQYNLLQPPKGANPLPHLRLRVDGPFELPFGRHCIRNEAEVLPELAERLWRALPAFVRALCDLYWDGRLASYGVEEKAFEELACALLHPPRRDGLAFLDRVPLFLGITGRHYTLEELTAAARAGGVLYLDDGSNAGADYAVFEAPVLSTRQPGDGLRLLEQEFKDTLVRLDVKDTVLEAPHREAALGPREQRFQQYLRFHPDFDPQTGGLAQARDPQPLRLVNLLHCLPAAADMHQARGALAELRFRVGYLVQRDGRTPCCGQRFLWKEKDRTVVVNLHHPEMAALLEASATDPALAGHWAIAVCLSDPGQRLLPHLTATARDHLLLLDALTKLGAAPAEEATAEADSARTPEFDRFLRGLGDLLR
jgi:hypothetical protein